jgi:hypothetical protein
MGWSASECVDGIVAESAHQPQERLSGNRVEWCRRRARGEHIPIPQTDLQPPPSERPATAGS